jgi:hypothetical protein
VIDTLIGIAVSALLCTTGGLLLWLNAERARDRGRVWTREAAAAGLSEIAFRRPFVGPMALRARAGRFVISIGSQSRDRDSEETCIALADSEEGLGAVHLRREEGMELAKLWGTREIELGDPGFDDAFFIGGPPAIVYAFLDADTRATLFRLNEEGFLEVAPSGIRARFLEKDDLRLVRPTIESLLGLANRLVTRGETAARLAKNAREEPYPRVRLGNLLCLIREFGEHPLVPGTLRAACDDAQAEIRLRAATALGNDGVETLIGMTEDMGLDDPWVAAAVDALGRRLSLERATRILGRALRARRLETARAVIGVLGAAGDPAALELLVRALRVDRGLVAAAAARALGTLGAPEAERPLIRALRGDAAGLRVAAAEALGRFASIAAVAPLKEVAERHRQAEFQRAARQAVAEIQARQPGASPGQLSLASPEAGQLSLANVEAGRLSFPAGEPGRLSLTDGKGGKP